MLKLYSAFAITQCSNISIIKMCFRPLHNQDTVSLSIRRLVAKKSIQLTPIKFVTFICNGSEITFDQRHLFPLSARPPCQPSGIGRASHCLARSFLRCMFSPSRKTSASVAWRPPLLLGRLRAGHRTRFLHRTNRLGKWTNKKKKREKRT